MVRSTLSYVAEGYSEVLQIQSTQFHALLILFPDFKKDFKMQTTGVIDYLRNTLTEMPAQKKYLNIDEKLKPEKPQRRSEKLIILPRSIFYRVWEYLEISGYCLGSFYLEMYEKATFEKSIVFFVLQYVFDVWNLVRIFIRFQRAYYDNYGVLITDIDMISKYYRKSIDFKIDIITIIPFDVVKFFMFKNHHLMQYLMTAILRMPKLLRLKFLFMFANEKMDKLNVNIMKIRLFQIFNV